MLGVITSPVISYSTRGTCRLFRRLHCLRRSTACTMRFACTMQILVCPVKVLFKKRGLLVCFRPVFAISFGICDSQEAKNTLDVGLPGDFLRPSCPSNVAFFRRTRRFERYDALTRHESGVAAANHSALTKAPPSNDSQGSPSNSTPRRAVAGAAGFCRTNNDSRRSPFAAHPYREFAS